MSLHESLEASAGRAALEHALSETIGAPVRLGQGRRPPMGAVMETVMVDATLDGARRTVVLRGDPVASLPESGGVAREARLMAALDPRAIPVPRVLAVLDGAQVPTGRDLVVLEALPGAAEPSVATGLPPRGSEALCRRLGGILAEIHRGPAPVGGPNGTRARLAAYREWATGVDSPAIAHGLDWATRHCPPPVAPCLLHRDFRTGNLLIHQGEIAGVIDWDFAGAGDPAEDIGWFTCRCWRFGQDARTAGGIGSYEAFIAGYAEAGGRVPPLNVVLYYRALAALRWAIIAVQQAARATALGASGLDAALTGRRLPALTLDLLDAIEAAERA